MISCWIVTEEGLTGTENQCCGVAEALGLSPVIKRIGLRQPWKTLSPWLGFECARTFTGTPLVPPWPDLVIAAGRKAPAAINYIKKQNRETFMVFLQNPRISPHHFDLVAAPAHDGLRGDNVIATQATPNMITPALLAEAKVKFAPLLEPLPAPRVAVLIGGNSKTHRMTSEIASRLAGQLKALADNGHGLMITASRRTPPECRNILQGSLGEDGLFWNGTSSNPYHGFLAWADYIIVTEDSASMISEAATTGKPVYTVPLEGGSARFGRLHNTLLHGGTIRKFEGKLEPYDYTPLNDAAMVAGEIRKRMKTDRT